MISIKKGDDYFPSFWGIALQEGEESITYANYLDVFNLFSHARLPCCSRMVTLKWNDSK